MGEVEIVGSGDPVGEGEAVGDGDPAEDGAEMGGHGGSAVGTSCAFAAA